MGEANNNRKLSGEMLRKWWPLIAFGVMFIFQAGIQWQRLTAIEQRIAANTARLATIERLIFRIEGIEK